MKKIAIISASMLALGAVSLGAADFNKPTPESQTVVSSASDFRTSRLSIEPVADPQPVQSRASVRRVLSGAIKVETCQDAYWPNIPAECLERVEATEPTGA
ncbi:hypothetical protein [Hoeflea sp.]|uniref:hypothetical protein n=1 Tax=Hoeflea sp. TaxID=1940281 RepID=UPI003BB1E263